MVDEHEDDDGVAIPRSPEDIDMWELSSALSSLILFDDTYLHMQATNVALVDRWMMDLETHVAKRLFDEERTPIDDAMLLNALSQMWLFAAYELLRTWRQRAKEVAKWIENGGLDIKIAALNEDKGYINFGKIARAGQLAAIEGDPSALDRTKSDLRRTHIPFSELEALRVSLAKHEVRGKPKMPMSAPGYSRIDRFTGSLSYELGGGRVILGYRTRRDVSDSLRAILDAPLPSDEELRDFDSFLDELGDESSLPAVDPVCPDDLL